MRIYFTPEDGGEWKSKIKGDPILHWISRPVVALNLARKIVNSRLKWKKKLWKGNVV